MAPKVIVVHAAAAAPAAALIRALRQDPATRGAGVAVLSAVADGTTEPALRQAGANIVRGPAVDPREWECRVRELVAVPPRRAFHGPAWLSPRVTGEALQGSTVNISTHGILIEAGPGLEPGMRLDLRLVLPDDPRPLEAVGQVVRASASSGDGFHYGVRFLVLREDAGERIAAFVKAGRPRA
jgi:hypothetical protein